MMNEPVILALDPGIGRTGYAVMRNLQNHIETYAYGCIETDKKLTLSDRIKLIYEELSTVVAKHRPSVMVLEQLFFSKNQTTAIAVGQAQGAMLLLAAQHSMEVSFVTPNQIKQTVTGYGNAGKAQVEKMVMVLLGLSQKIKLDDTADALACGITYLSTHKF